MLRRHKQALHVFRRVRDFLKESPPEVALGDVTPVVAQLSDVITRLEANAGEQDARARQALLGTRVKRAGVRALRKEFLYPIARAARLLFPDKPELLAAFAMPRAKDYAGAIAAAGGMAQAAEPHLDAFVSIGLKPDVVARVRKAAEDLRGRIDAREVDVGKRSASTAGLRREYARGRELVRMLDAMIEPRLTATPQRLAEWRTFVRFARLSPRATEDADLPETPDEGVPPVAEAGKEVALV